jgi:tRNA1(Val) A37 N6-methylase TrmN6
MDVSSGHLLGGKISYAQPVAGYRTGIEPVLLAASVPAREGERVLEFGTGAGAAVLCLAHRLKRVGCVAVERDPAMADLARRNVASNGFSGRISIVTGDVTGWDDGEAKFDHACANPPWHDALSTPSPNAARADAKQAGRGALGTWVAAMASRLVRRGSLTVILPAALLAEGIAALSDAGCGAASLLPLWPLAGRPAKLILLQAIRDADGPCRVLAGLVLHRDAGGYTQEAEAILRHGGPSALGGGVPQVP